MLRLIAVALILTEHVPWHHLGRAAGVDAGLKGNQSRESRTILAFGDFCLS